MVPCRCWQTELQYLTARHRLQMDSRVTRLFMVLDFLETCVDEKAKVTVEHLYQDHPTRQSGSLRPILVSI